MSAFSGVPMADWLRLIEDLQVARGGEPRPWTFTCTVPGCPGLMLRGRCVRCRASR